MLATTTRYVCMYVCMYVCCSDEYLSINLSICCVVFFTITSYLVMRMMLSSHLLLYGIWLHDLSLSLFSFALFFLCHTHTHIVPADDSMQGGLSSLCASL